MMFRCTILFSIFLFSIMFSMCFLFLKTGWTLHCLARPLFSKRRGQVQERPDAIYQLLRVPELGQKSERLRLWIHRPWVWTNYMGLHCHYYGIIMGVPWLIWLVVWNHGIWFFMIFLYIGNGMSSSQLTFTPSFFRGVGLNHQPVMDFHAMKQVNLPSEHTVRWTSPWHLNSLYSIWRLDVTRSSKEAPFPIIFHALKSPTLPRKNLLGDSHRSVP